MKIFAMETEDSNMERMDNSEYVNLPKKVRLSKGMVAGENEHQFDFSSAYEEKFPGVGKVSDRDIIPSMRYADQQQDTVELSLEGLQSSGQSTLVEDNQSCSTGDFEYGIAIQELTSRDIASGVIHSSESLADEKENIPHGVSDGVFEIAPLKLQVSETKPGVFPAVEEALRQGRQPFEVVLRGGGPWGFALNGGTCTGLPVYISKIVENGKSSDSALMEGDYILQINSLSCADVGQALDIVDTATNTLTLMVLRGQWNPPIPGPVATSTSSATNSSSGGQPQNLLQRAYDLQRKDKDSTERSSGQRALSSDDSVVFAASRSSQQLGMRTGRRRGESFNVGRLSGRRESPNPSKPRNSASSASSSRGGRISFSSSPSGGQKQPSGAPVLSPSPVWSVNEPRRSSSSAAAAAPPDLDTGHPRPAAAQRLSEQWSAPQDDMNRRRSDGYGLGGGASRYSGGQENMHPSNYYHQQQQHRNSHYSLPQQQQTYQQQPKKQSNLQLFSMKSSPNLAHFDQAERREFEPGGARGSHQQSSSSRSQMSTARSSPNIQADINNSNLSQPPHQKQQQQGQVQEQKSPDYMNITSSTPDLLLMRGSGRHVSPGDLTPTSSSSSQVPLSVSHGLHRYQADYENLSHLSVQPLGSEKISEISDIDEITGQDSLPTSPQIERNFVKGSNPSDTRRAGTDGHSGCAPVGGPPTRDPMALKYIKVNQSHEKYPSWPVTQSNMGSASGDQAASINSRAQSMTDHTNTSSEFPKKQRFAYSPGLKPLAERISPTSGADDNGKSARNTSDPGFKKSDFVYDQIGRVKQRGHDAVDQRFEDFYKNSQPGYPPPAMDSDGHNIGDKEYSAPSPPERDAKAVSERELSEHLTDYLKGAESSSSTSQLRSGQSPGRDGVRLAALPSNLNIAATENISPHQSVSMVDSANSPMDFASPLTSPSRPLSEEFVSRPLTHFKSERYRPSQVQYRDNSTQPNIQRDRPNSYTASHSSRDSAQRAGGLNSKGVIVGSTPYYNTSTQTDMMPYAIKVSHPLAVASKLRNAQVQASEFSSQTSPKYPQQELEEKSIQERLSRDFQEPPNVNKESGEPPKHWLTAHSVGQDSAQLVNKASSGSRFFNYPNSGIGLNTNYHLLNQQSSPFPGIKSIQEKYATDEVANDTENFTNVSNANKAKTGSETIDDHGSIRSAFSDNSASILRKLSEEFYGNRDKQQRASSNSSSSISAVPEHQSHSPRLDLASTISQQPGLREAESYSSVVIHHDQSLNLFGRDDYSGSVSSVSGDSLRQDSSNYSDVSIGGGSNSGRQQQQQVIQDAIGTSRSRRSLDPSYFSQKSRLQGQDPRVSSSMASLAGQQNKKYHHQRDLSAPASSTSFSLSQSSQNVSSNYPLPGLNKRRPHDLSIISDSSVASNPKSSSSEARSSHSTSFGSNTASPSATQTGAQPTTEDINAPANMRPFSTSSIPSQDNESLKRLSSRRGSDSVFVGDDDPNDDYEFNRKPSMRKAYGIYDETERLISMTFKPPDKAKNPSTNGSGSVSSSSESSASSHSARAQRYADGLGLIHEEAGDDNKSSTTSSAAVSGRKDHQPQKYAWQDEIWRRSRIDIPKGSNLKRTTSEQISVGKVEGQNSVRGSTSKLRSSLDSDSHTTRNSIKNSDYENSSLFLGRPGSQHNRTQSEDLANPSREAELKRLQQQALLSFYQRKTTGSTPSPSDQGKQFPGKAGTNSSGSSVPLISSLSYSPDSSLYESIGGKGSGGISPTESVAEIISKANENLAKSAQRVDSIRRSNSTKPYHGSGYGLTGEYMDMAARHERMRKETDWSRMRSSGSLRYSPDSSSTDPRRSNRSSFASENHYEDISMFANSTPRGSVSESVPDSGFSGASMDSGVVTSSGGSQDTYQNLPTAKRRPPPPPPQDTRDLSPEGPPPALPPRRYREPTEVTNNNIKNKLGESLGFEPSPFDPQANSTHSPASGSPRDSTDKQGGRIHVIPLNRHQQQQQQHQKDGEEDGEVVQRDFKSLMSHWENNSPREDRYAAELRKQAQKFSHSQPPSQQLNPTSMALKHSRTPINFSTTYKREPALPQEATSPASSSPAPSEATTGSSTSSATQPQQHHPSHPQSSSPSGSKQFSTSSPPPSSSQTSASAVRLNTNIAASTVSEVSSPPPPQLPERIFGLQQQPDSGRLRSSSDASPTHSSTNSGREVQSSSNRYSSGGPVSPSGRDRSASDHDILSDRRPGVGQQYNQGRSHVDTPPQDGSPPRTQWQSRRAQEVPPPPQQQAQGQQLSDTALSMELPPPPPELLQSEEEKFAEDSYIGHKSKSSRPIGTYQRSKSAAVLPTSGASNNTSSGGSGSNNITNASSGRSVSTVDNPGLRAGGPVGAAGVDDALSPFPSSRLGHQQTWNSEIVLSSSAHAQAAGAIDSNPSPPSRPARPSAQHARYDSGGGGGDLVSSVAASASPAGSSSSTSPSSYRRDVSNIPRRQPPPVPDAGVGPSSDDTILPDQSQFWPSSPKSRANPGSLKDRQWVSQDTGSYRSPTTSPASSSHANNTSSSSTLTSPPRSPGEVVSQPLALPPRDYKRRESAPTRPNNSNISTLDNSRLQTPFDPSDRRQSDSSTSSFPSSAGNNSGASSGLDSQALSLHPSSLSPSHSRQPSQEELECDQHVQVLAKHLAGKGADQKLSEVLRLDTDKKRMQFMDGLFSQSQSSLNTTSFDGNLPSSGKETIPAVSSTAAHMANSGGAPPAISISPTSAPSTNGTVTGNKVHTHNGSSPSEINADNSQRSSLPKEYWMTPSKAVLEMEWRKNEGLGKDLTKDINDSGSLVKQKEALLEKLHKKLEVLKEGKLSLQQEIADNDLLGTQVRTQVEARCQSRAERDKFTSFLEDLEKIVRLLLNLSGQLARAENAVQALSPEVDGKLRKLTLDKRERLYAKHEEAKLLKDDLDKRGEQVTAMLKERLLPAQLADYVHFVQTRSQLTIELQEMEDKITLGGEQIQALKKSIPETKESDLQVTETSRSDLSDPAPS